MDDWINVSRLYNWVNRDQLLDWLDMYGVDKGHIKDEPMSNYVEEIDLSVFTRNKGYEFEDRVLRLIQEQVDVAVVEGAPGNSDPVFEQTLRLMSEDREAIYQGLVRDDDRMVFGVPDLIIRGDALERLVKDSLEGPTDTYYVLDTKYTSLKLNKKGDLSAKHRWGKVQLTMYEGALATMLDRDLNRSYLLGRSASGAAGGCFDVLGWTKAGDSKTLATVDEGLQWIRDLNEHGSDWSIEPPSDPRLVANPKRENRGAWAQVIEQLLPGETDEGEDVPPVSPAHIAANRADWIDNRGIEFYVDFETLNNLNDDFSQLPKMGGRPMIFMIGCGHEENGEFIFKVWTAQEETYEEEKRITEEWLNYMEETRRRVAPEVERPHVFHWFRHEPDELGKAAGRHEQTEWREVPWYDLLAKVMKAEPVIVRGSDGNSLKPITRSMKEMALIQTVWGDSQVSGGTEAMTAAWWCYQRAKKTGESVEGIAIGGKEPLMPQVEAYNSIDCKAMWEILGYLRRNH